MASQVVSIFRMPGLPVLLRPVPVASSPRIQYSHFRLQNFFGRAPPLHELSYGARRGTATFTLACSYGNGGGSGHSLQVLAAQTLSVLTSIQPFAYIISAASIFGALRAAAGFPLLSLTRLTFSSALRSLREKNLCVLCVIKTLCVLCVRKL